MRTLRLGWVRPLRSPPPTEIATVWSTWVSPSQCSSAAVSPWQVGLASWRETKSWWLSTSWTTLSHGSQNGDSKPNCKLASYLTWTESMCLLCEWGILKTALNSSTFNSELLIALLYLFPLSKLAFFLFYYVSRFFIIHHTLIHSFFIHSFWKWSS